MIAPDEGAHAFETLLRYDRGYTGYVPTTGAPWLAALVAAQPVRRSVPDAGEQHASRKFRAACRIRTLSRDEWPARLRRLIAEQTGLILRRAVDPDRPFAEHGLDSLGNLELRTRIEAETGIRSHPEGHRHLQLGAYFGAAPVRDTGGGRGSAGSLVSREQPGRGHSTTQLSSSLSSEQRRECIASKGFSRPGRCAWCSMNSRPAKLPQL